MLLPLTRARASPRGHTDRSLAGGRTIPTPVGSGLRSVQLRRLQADGIGPFPSDDKQLAVLQDDGPRDGASDRDVYDPGPPGCRAVELLDEWEAEAARLGEKRTDPAYWPEGEVWLRARSGRDSG